MVEALTDDFSLRGVVVYLFDLILPSVLGLSQFNSI